MLIIQIWQKKLTPILKLLSLKLNCQIMQIKKELGHASGFDTSDLGAKKIAALKAKVDKLDLG